MKPQSEIRLACSHAYKIYDSSGRLADHGEKFPLLTARAKDDGILLGKSFFPGVFLRIQSENHGIQVGGKRTYRDTVVIRRTRGDRIELINHIPVDDYLKGVIPFEANPLWTLEALKVQAVASRTFAVFKMIEQADQPYDVSSGIFSQVYAGKKIENPKTNQAVEDTRGEILVYKNKIFPGYFHSTCGGRTTGADLVWRVKPLDPLRGVECKFCAKSPHYRWEAVFTASEIKEKTAQKGGIPVQEVKGIKLGKIDAAGRAHEVLIQSTWMERSVDADAFRVWMGPEKMKSNLITGVAAMEGNRFRFKGRGWGHGVGVCQYGMKYLGELGYGYREILGYYYPGALLTKLSDPAPKGTKEQD